MARQFVICTRDFSGLGWAKKLMEEGETVTVAHQNEEDDPKLKKQYDHVGKDWLTMMPLSEAFDKLRTDETYWIFAENNFPEEADALRRKGQRHHREPVLADMVVLLLQLRIVFLILV